MSADLLSLVHHCPCLLHHLCHFPASCHRAVPKDWPSDIPGKHYICLGISYGKVTGARRLVRLLTFFRLAWASLRNGRS
jgi:hypothetical protein